MNKCWVCGNPNIHIHEIYYGAKRQISIQNGFCVGLCPKHHNMSNDGVHFNLDLDLKLKKACQKEYEKSHTREEFIKLIGRNYL